MVPVSWKGHCLAACKTVVSNPAGDGAFVRKVELLSVLVENFLLREANLVNGVMPRKLARVPAGGDGRDPLQASHRRVGEAIEHVHRHLSDPGLSVKGVAKALGMNATYLAHLFATDTGVRLRRYIASRRVERAKELLATTTWPIKCIAFDIGQANSDWFSQFFRAHTGVTPGDFRRQAHGASARPVRRSTSTSDPP